MAKVTSAMAVPSSCGATAFCVDTVETGNIMPTPVAMTVRMISIATSGASAGARRQGLVACTEAARQLLLSRFHAVGLVPTQVEGLNVALDGTGGKVTGMGGHQSAAMLKDFGVRFAIVGHSERRQYHGESDEAVALKAQRALAAGITPIVCVGETLAEREAGEQ